MHIGLQPTVASVHTIYRPTTIAKFQQPAVEYGPSTVTISQEGRLLGQKTNSKFGVDALDKVQTLDELKDALKGADFHSMSPEETAHLTGALHRTGSFDAQAIGNFFIALDTETALGQTEKVDVVEHFNQRLNTVQEAVKTDSDFTLGVELRKKGIQLLNTLIGWTA